MRETARHLFVKGSSSSLQHPLEHLHWWLRKVLWLPERGAGAETRACLSCQRSSQWERQEQPSQSPWVLAQGGLFATSSEMCPLISLSQGGLAALGAGGEILITLVATSKCFTRHMTGRAALRSALLRGCYHSASPGTKAGPHFLGWTACHLLPPLQDESMWAHGHADRLLSR